MRHSANLGALTHVRSVTEQQGTPAWRSEQAPRLASSSLSAPPTPLPLITGYSGEGEARHALLHLGFFTVYSRKNLLSPLDMEFQ